MMQTFRLTVRTQERGITDNAIIFALHFTSICSLNPACILPTQGDKHTGKLERVLKIVMDKFVEHREAFVKLE